VPASFDNSIVSQVQRATDIVDVISEHLSLNRKGKEFVGLCPFHTDHRPSLYVNPAKQIFKCFSCGAGGDVLKFVQLREGLSFPEAIERLAHRAGIKYERRQSRRPDASGGSNRFDAKAVAKVNDWAMKFWQRMLTDRQTGKVARDYIASRRISDESVRQWLLGFAPDGWDNLVSPAKKAGISEALLTEAGLAVSGEKGLYDKFRNRLMFPILDVTGRAIGFGGRTLGDDPAKYMNSPATVLFDKSNSVYGLDKARHEIVSGGTAVVVEGYTDVIMAHQFGCCNVVAALGTSFTTGHATLLRRYGKSIVLVFDSDTAGMEAANRALEVCIAQRIDIRLAFAGEGMDPCDFVLKEGGEGFKALLDGAVDVMEYKWRRLEEGFSSSDNMTDRRNATQEYLQTLAKALETGRIDAMTEGAVVSRVSQLTGMSQKQVRSELDNYRKRAGGNRVVRHENQTVSSIAVTKGSHVEAQKEILEVLLNKPALCDRLEGTVSAEHFTEGVLREAAEAMFYFLDQGQLPQLRDVLSRIESSETSAEIMKLEADGERKGNFEPRLEAAVETIRSHVKAGQKQKIRSMLSDDDREILKKHEQLLSSGAKGQRSPGVRRI
jgi:DNA primase